MRRSRRILDQLAVESLSIERGRPFFEFVDLLCGPSMSFVRNDRYHPAVGQKVDHSVQGTDGRRCTGGDGTVAAREVSQVEHDRRRPAGAGGFQESSRSFVRLFEKPTSFQQVLRGQSSARGVDGSRLDVKADHAPVGSDEASKENGIPPVADRCVDGGVAGSDAAAHDFMRLVEDE